MDIPGSPDITKQLAGELHKSASNGDVTKVTRLLSGLADVNKTDDQGWTALMYASRNGHEKIVKLLLEKNCDLSLVNKSGQTALEIADFWNQTSIVHLLIQHSKEQADDDQDKTTNFFGYNPLDRSANRRTDKEWLTAVTKDPKTKFLLFSQSSPYVQYNEDGSCHLCPFSYSQVSGFLDAPSNPPTSVLLGLGQVQINTSDDSNEEQSAWFALDVSNAVTEEEVQKINPDAQLMSLKNPMAIMSFKDQEAGVLAQARSMLEWHDRYKFCPTCGSTMTAHEAGYKRKCDKQDCRSNRGIHNTSYPRTDPVAIMIVISPDGTKCLLGRKKQFPRGMYSCLAGFMEPGETIEDAVRREVHEESGVRVGKVEYHSSQPWPMPSQLMIGCIAYATTTDITIDREELEDARWFPKHQVVKAFQGRAKGDANALFFPPRQTIAHQLTKAWIGMSSNL